jgi:hypothetical protein
MRKATSQRQPKTATQSPNTRLGSSRERRAKPATRMTSKKPSQLVIVPTQPDENVTTDDSFTQPSNIYVWGCKFLVRFTVILGNS